MAYAIITTSLGRMSSPNPTNPGFDHLAGSICCFCLSCKLPENLRYQAPAFRASIEWCNKDRPDSPPKWNHGMKSSVNWSLLHLKSNKNTVEKHETRCLAVFGFFGSQE